MATEFKYEVKINLALRNPTLQNTKEVVEELKHRLFRPLN